MIGARSTSAASSMLSARNAQTVGTLPAPSRGAEFSITELQWQYGRLKVPSSHLAVNTTPIS